MLKGQDWRVSSIYERRFQIRIGVHFGDVVIGSLENLGMAMVVVSGDAVNFASWVEAANEQIGTNLLISKNTSMS